MYLHDFGSILAFIENNFKLGIGNINSSNNYPFADAFAPGSGNGNIPLSDFFPISQNNPRQFDPIILRQDGRGTTPTTSLTTTPTAV